MKRFLTAILFIALTSQYSYAVEKVKIGFVDLQRALNEGEVGKKVKTELEALAKQKQAPINEKVKERDRLEDELQTQSMTLSDEALRQRGDELEKLQRDIERMVSDYNLEMQKKQREKEVSILKELDDIINGLGQEDGYTIILPADVILFSAEGVDLTDAVMERHSRMKKQKSSGISK